MPLLLRLPQTEAPPAAAAAGPPGTPYASPPCRAALYQLLLALVLAPAPAGAPPLHCALRAFGQGQRDPALQVRRGQTPPQNPPHPTAGIPATPRPSPGPPPPPPKWDPQGPLTLPGDPRPSSDPPIPDLGLPHPSGPPHPLGPPHFTTGPPPALS